MKKLFLLFACTATLQLSAQRVMVANFEGDGTDRWFENRIVLEDAVFELNIVDNPKDDGINESKKVLKFSNITSPAIAARFSLGLCNNIANSPVFAAEDSIVMFNWTEGVIYDTFRCKIYLEGNTINDNFMPYLEFWDYSPSLEDGTLNNGQLDPEKNQPHRTLGEWENFPEGQTTWSDWNIFTFKYVPNNFHGRIAVVINNGIWGGPDPGVTFYIDDIELFNSENPHSSSVAIYKNDKLNYSLSGKHLKVNEIPTGSVLSILDISGRTLFTSTIYDNSAGYSFKSEGLYFISLKNGKESITQKIFVK